jgi:hypothetical protein
MTTKKQCKGKTKSGAPCGMAPLAGSKFCFTHDPTSAAARALAHKTGGERTRADHGSDGAQVPQAPRTINDAMIILDYTLRELLPLENSIQRARTLIALVAGYIDALKVGEIEARLAAIESALKARPEAQQ